MQREDVDCFVSKLDKTFARFLRKYSPAVAVAPPEGTVGEEGVGLEGEREEDETQGVEMEGNQREHHLLIQELRLSD